uniref:Mediator of RNA polymerase II transcription subunit 14 n=1 Tax=Parastrongyloides trichosuri TaxID=131310 RepID=A0A0N5A492_PARTI
MLLLYIFLLIPISSIHETIKKSCFEHYVLFVCDKSQFIGFYENEQLSIIDVFYNNNYEADERTFVTVTGQGSYAETNHFEVVKPNDENSLNNQILNIIKMPKRNGTITYHTILVDMIHTVDLSDIKIFTNYPTIVLFIGSELQDIKKTKIVLKMLELESLNNLKILSIVFNNQYMKIAKFLTDDINDNFLYNVTDQKRYDKVNKWILEKICYESGEVTTVTTTPTFISTITHSPSTFTTSQKPKKCNNYLIFAIDTTSNILNIDEFTFMKTTLEYNVSLLITDIKKVAIDSFDIKYNRRYNFNDIKTVEEFMMNIYIIKQRNDSSLSLLFKRMNTLHIPHDSTLSTFIFIAQNDKKEIEKSVVDGKILKNKGSLNFIMMKSNITRDDLSLLHPSNTFRWNLTSSIMSDDSNYSDDSSSDTKDEGGKYISNDKLSGGLKRKWNSEGGDSKNRNMKDMELEELLSDLPVVSHQQHNHGMIPFGMLLQFASHKISQELIVLSELIPKAYDQSKKISLVEFSFVTMNLFSKILAIVKWYTYFKKYRLCTPIQNFLDLQSQIFRDTADALCGIARVELAGARLPYFEMQAALNNIWGEHNILPLAIKKRFVPDPPISSGEQPIILSKLNQVLKNRLSLISSKIPVSITEITIKNGTATFKVIGEYEVTLTLLSAEVAAKWTILHIKILVEQHDIGYGTQLVHPLQLHNIHQHLQRLMYESKNPINTMHDFMHKFCLSLQLDVLYCEATQLTRKQYFRKLLIEKYDIEKGELLICYWPNFDDKKRVYPSEYKIRISHSKSPSYRGLRVYHIPYRAGMPQLDTNTGRLSLCTLINTSSSIRANDKLLALKQKLSIVNPMAGSYISGCSIRTIIFPLIEDSKLLDDEYLTFKVNLYTGAYHCSSSFLKPLKNIKELNDALNGIGSIKQIRELINEIRVNLFMEKYSAIIKIHYLIISEITLPEKARKYFSEIKDAKLCVRFHHDLPYYCVFVFVKDTDCSIVISQYTIFKNCRGDFVITPFMYESKKCHANVAKNNVEEVYDVNDYHPIIHFEDEIKDLILTMDMSIRHKRLEEDFMRKGVSLDEFNIKQPYGDTVVNIVNIPSIPLNDSAFFRTIVKIRMLCDNRIKVLWPFECTVRNVPIISDFFEYTSSDEFPVYLYGKKNLYILNRSSSSLYVTNANIDIVSTNFIEKMTTFAMMYKQIEHFSHSYYNFYRRYCNIKFFSFHKLVIAYGKDRDQLMYLTYKPSRKQYLISFGQDNTRKFSLGYDSNEPSNFTNYINAHNIVSYKLSEMTKKNYFLTELIHYLVNTSDTLTHLYRSIKPVIKSTEIFGQISREMVFFTQEYQLELYCQSEYFFKIVTGTISLGIFIYDSNSVFLKDCSYGEPMLVGLERFIKTQTDGVRVESLFKMTSSERNNYYGASRRVFRLPSIAFKKLTVPHSVEKNYSVLGKYIANIRAFDKLRIIFTQRKEKTIFKGCNIRINHVQRTSYYIKVIYQGAQLPKQINPPTIHFTVYLEPNTFNIKAKIEYDGSIKPPVEAIKKIEEYFEKTLSHGNCPQGVYSFMNILRLTYPTFFSNIAALMNWELNPQPTHFYRLKLDLISNDHRNPDNTVQYSPSFLIEEKSFRVLVPITLRPQKLQKNKNVDSSRIKLNAVWDINKNSFFVHKPSTDLLKSINDKITKQNELTKDSKDCNIESCVRIILTNNFEKLETQK